MSSTTPTINDRQKSVLIVKKVIVVIVITDTTLPTLKLFAIVLLLLLDIEGQRKKKKRKVRSRKQNKTIKYEPDTFPFPIGKLHFKAYRSTCTISLSLSSLYFLFLSLFFLFMCLKEEFTILNIHIDFIFKVLESIQVTNQISIIISLVTS